MCERVDTAANNARREEKEDERDDPMEIVIVKYDPKVVDLESTGTPENGVTTLHGLHGFVSLSCPQTAVTEDGRTS